MYTKTNWVDNTTPIDKNNLNKIEQGIYDNSLVVDAIANKLNPTDTETYKTAELTEGQITDVIGINNILIKGNTSQDGEPTPSSPIDVNVVSGSNVINTSNKNLFDVNNINLNGTTSTNNGVTLTYKNGYINLKGTATAQTDFYLFGTWSGTTSFIKLKTGQYAISITTSNKSIRFYINKASATISVTNTSTGINTFTLSENTDITSAFIRIPNGTTINENIYLQLELGSTATTYEPHQGKELSLDLPVENLFYYSDNFVSGTNAGITVTKQSDGSYTFIGTATSTGVNVWLNGNYNNYNDMVIENALFKIPAGKTITVTDLRVYMVYENLTKKAVAEGTTLTLPQDAYIMAFRALDTTPNTTYNRVCYPQLEISSKANAYTPYGIEPIELCKIGNYQDYFYKSGSKWYLKKYFKKRIFVGANDEGWARSENGKFNNLSETDYMPNNQGAVWINTHFKTLNNQDNSMWIGNTGFLNCWYSNANTVSDFTTWLASNNVTLYYLLKTPTDTEIIDTTLISQLEAIYNAPLYEQTNITQTNNDLSMVLDITACKDNINGIKAFIRK